MATGTRYLKPNRSHYFRASALGIGALGLVISGTTATVASASPSKVGAAKGATGTVAYWDRAGFTLPPALVKEFNASHPGLKVVFTPVNTTTEPTKLATAIRAGTAPDLVGIDDAEIGEFIAEGAMENVTTQLEGMSAFKDLNAGQLASVGWNGKYYGFPEYADLSVLYWNKTLFKQAGLDPNAAPANFAQILSDAKKITALGNGDYGFSFAGECPGCLAFTILPNIYATGQNLTTGPLAHQTATVQNSVPLKEALTLYNELWTDKLVPSSDQSDVGTTWGNDFVTGKIGIIPLSYDYATTLAQDHVKFSWGMAPLPGPTGGYSTYDGGADFGIPNGAKNVPGALEFVNWVLQQAQQVSFPTYGLTPVRTDVLTPSYKAKYPLDAIALKALARGNLALGPAVNDIYHPLNGGWQVMFDQAVFKGQVAAALKTGQSMFTEEIASAS
jgi:multiple sugar transport system substrate-binding protein